MNPPLPDGLPIFSRCGKNRHDFLMKHGYDSCPDCGHVFSPLTLPEEDAKPKTRRRHHYGNCRVMDECRCQEIDEEADEDAKTEGETDSVALLRAMAHNYRNGHSWDDLDNKACLQAADALAKLRVEVEKWIQIANDRSQEATEWTRKFIDQRDRAVALREENKRLREWQPISSAPEDSREWFLVWYPATKSQIEVSEGRYTGHQKIEQGRLRDHWPEIEGLCWIALPAAPENQGEGGEG